MIGFDWWWALPLLPLPLLARRLLPARDSAQLAVRVPLLQQDIADAMPKAGSLLPSRRIWPWLFWICLLLAASRPFWLGEPITRNVSGRDLMLAVDISGSMKEADMTINGEAASGAVK